MKLARYNKMALFAKSIELITLTALTMLKDLFIQSKNSCSALSSSILQYKNDNYLENSLLVPFFTDKNCSGIMNNRLISSVESIVNVLSYKNILSIIHGTGVTFQKKWNNLNKSSDNMLVDTIGNIYNLSNESFTFYKSYLLFRYLILLDFNTFFILFNKYLSIYMQEINYYYISSFNYFFKWISSYTFLEIDKDNLKNIYIFSICVLLLDMLLLNNFSELGSRATAMKNTVKNAEDNIKELTFVFNRLRQSKITNEIIEILSGTL